MDRRELVNALKSTLDDLRLSRTEKNVLRELVSEEATTSEALAVLRSEAFEIARQELISPQAGEVLQWLEEIVKLLVTPTPQTKLDSEAVFSTREDCAKYLQGLISSCRRTIDVCVFTITDDRITRSLVEAHRRKVEVRVISDDEKSSDAGSDIQHLKQSGIAIKTDRDPNHMHHKFALFDGQRLLNGSYNWTRSASLRNEENFVVTNDRKLVREFNSHFEYLWHLFD
ncbi:MAG: phospholipase D-like domain-containing protein [Planctomycetota bacterium]|nr:phospholipase D-like domain-containing protein [Planctomycetota bacterium]